MQFLYVGLGGVVGSILRYLISLLGSFLAPIVPSYIGTFVANLLGAFALGWITSKWFQQPIIPKDWQLAIGTGVLGSFTTFSTFTVESLVLLQHHKSLGFGVYLLSSVVGGLTSAYLGFCLGQGKKGHAS